MNDLFNKCHFNELYKIMNAMFVWTNIYSVLWQKNSFNPLKNNTNNKYILTITQIQLIICDKNLSNNCF